MRDAVIVAARRSAIGRRGRAHADTHAIDLFAAVIADAVETAGVDPGAVEDVIWGCVTQFGEQSGDVARLAALAAGLPETVPGVTVDRQCGSSQQAIAFAAALVISGQCDVVVAGGGEHMTRVPMGTNATPDSTPFAAEGWQARFGSDAPHQSSAAELVARRFDLTRPQLDEYALRSHERAARAQKDGLFDDELTVIRGVDHDEGVRPDTSLAALAALPPAFRADGLITAGNASQISDGAAAVVVATSEYCANHGLRPLVRIHGNVSVGADPILMLTAPVEATARVLARAGLPTRDIGAFEVNEAFACVPLMWQRETGVGAEPLNPLGGAIALGHPLGGSGARLAVTLAHHMRREGIRWGLQTMCEAGGQANATIYELLSR